MTTPTMDAAVRLAERGIAVFPLRPRTKAPYGRTIGLHMASADVRTARERWAGRWMLPLMPIERLREKNPGKSDDWLLRPAKAQPSANVAIATGAPAGFWVLDEDGPEASAWIAAREAEHGPLPETVEQQTARGRHRCFAWNAEAAAADISNRSQLSGAPLDVRGEGGYIVVAPSIHPGDTKKGVPPGFVYRWRPGHAPWEMDFAPAPAWLVALVKPKEAPAPVEAKPHVRVEGRASAYGEAALDRAVATIQAARVGSRDSTLYSASCSIGRLVAGGEIEDAYARSALENAGRVHVPSAMSEGQLIRQVDRALAFGAMNPKSADPARQQTGGAPRRAEGAKTPARTAGFVSSAVDVAAVWAEGVPADVGMVRTWLKLRRLAFSGPWATVALSALKAHPCAPWSERPDDRGPSLLMPLSPPGSTDVEALAIVPLAGGRGDRGADHPVHWIGDPTRKACVLAPAGASRQMLVTLDLQDAWSLGAEIADSDDAMGVAVTTTLHALCGGALGDKWGRVSASTPKADPDDAPWTMAGLNGVWLAMRLDLRLPEMRERKAIGGTRKINLSGEAAAKFAGAIATQAWRRPVDAGGPGANPVRLLSPTDGVGFHSFAESGF